MICPQCGTRNRVGRQRCTACGHPFTRAAARTTTSVQSGGQAVTVTNDQARVVPVRRSRYRQAAPRKRRGTFGCLLIIMTTAGLIALLVIGGLIATDRLIQPVIVDRVGSEVDRGIRTAVEQSLGRPELQETQQESSEPTTTGSDAPATDQAASPADEVTISEATINERLANSGDLGPIDQATVNVTPGGVQVDLEAYGVPGTYHTDLRAENGQIVLDNGSLDGPLGYVVPAGELEQVANNALASTLNDYGYQIEGVALRDEAIALTIRQ